MKNQKQSVPANGQDNTVSTIDIDFDVTPPPMTTNAEQFHAWLNACPLASQREYITLPINVTLHCSLWLDIATAARRYGITLNEAFNKLLNADTGFQDHISSWAINGFEPHRGFSEKLSRERTMEIAGAVYHQKQDSLTH